MRSLQRFKITDTLPCLFSQLDISIPLCRFPDHEVFILSHTQNTTSLKQLQYHSEHLSALPNTMPQTICDYNERVEDRGDIRDYDGDGDGEEQEGGHDNGDDGH